MSRIGSFLVGDRGKNVAHTEAVGILTLEGNSNFGNVLQNFALQRSIQSLGIPLVETIYGVPRGPSRIRIQQARIESFLRDPIGLLKRAKRRATALITRSQPMHGASGVSPERSTQISRFVSERIAVCPVLYSNEGTRRTIRSTYTHFIVGSDQVWNPEATNANQEWFLGFARPEQRVAYAASFGAPTIPRRFLKRYRDGLRGIAQISVREHQGADLVEKLIGRRPAVVLDPTMLLGSQYWRDLASLPSELEGKEFVVSFRLKQGDSELKVGSTTVARSDLVSKYARENGIEVVDLFSPTTPSLIGISPLEFIGVIGAARLVITDSFHAAVFSTLFHTPFLLEQRGNMNSRFETLLHHTGLKDRMLDEVTDVEAALDVDWDAVDRRLEQRRQESLDFLASALGLTYPGEHC